MKLRSDAKPEPLEHRAGGLSAQEASVLGDTRAFPGPAIARRFRHAVPPRQLAWLPARFLLLQHPARANLREAVVLVLEPRSPSNHGRGLYDACPCGNGPRVVASQIHGERRLAFRLRLILATIPLVTHSKLAVGDRGAHGIGLCRHGRLVLDDVARAAIYTNRW